VGRFALKCYPKWLKRGKKNLKVIFRVFNPTKRK
jgi:hypothetical protein